jgi:hypothetical protein
MMKSLRNYYSIVILLCCFIMAGCVGTVQEAKPPESLKMTNPPETFPFNGIISARGISHSRVELEFFPQNADGITYNLYVNESNIPIPIDPQSLLQIAGGRFLYTVENLLPDREYKFKITALNTKTAAVSTQENEAYARTYDNIVANFKGISKVSLVPGNTHGSILVDWIAPAMSGIFTAGPYDPAHYEVTLISSIGGLGNLNNPFYAGTDRRVILVPTPPLRASPLSNPSSSIIDGLLPGTQYYVQVRAINTLYQNFDEDPSITSIPVSREKNTRFLSIRTDSAGSLFDFMQNNVVLVNAPGSDAFDKIDVFWQPGTGSFTGYRIFITKYEDIGDFTIDDKLTEPTLVSMTSSGNYFSIAPNLTNRRITGLDSYGQYQVKVALCKVVSCPIAATDPNAAIISELNSIIVRPILAPFNGLNSIQPPGQFSQVDTVRLTFDAPLVGVGFANLMEFYCVDPSDHSQMVTFDANNPIVSSGVSNCDGLYLDGSFPPLANYTSQRVRGLTTDGTREYCFAASPAIIGVGPELRIDLPGRIVRCSYPEVFPPSVAQFPGLQNSCAVSGVKGNVSWNLPTGGIYSGFRVFWKEKTNNMKFSFPEAVANGPGYFTSGDLTASTLSYEADNLMPGKTYQIGVLAFLDMPDPQVDLYSEYNLKVLDCVVPLPIATFKGFTRIFAVGPKVDGRVPNDQTSKAPPKSSWFFEAMDSVGQPYEVAKTSNLVPDLSLNYVVPPGRDHGIDFTQPFDGINDFNGYAMSKTGIISLAWEEVDMSFPEADTIFTSATNQPPPPASRTGRKFGYKVYRSANNMLTWTELTITNGLIYSMNYSYRDRANSAPINKRMAFFY